MQNNSGGAVDITDAATIRRYDEKMFALSKIALKRADVGKDDGVCSIDAAWI